MSDKIVIDRSKIEELAKSKLDSDLSEFGRGTIETCDVLLQQSTPLESVIKPLLEEIWDEATYKMSVWGNLECADKFKEKFIQSILNKLSNE